MLHLNGTPWGLSHWENLSTVMSLFPLPLSLIPTSDLPTSDRDT